VGLSGRGSCEWVSGLAPQATTLSIPPPRARLSAPGNGYVRTDTYVDQPQEAPP